MASLMRMDNGLHGPAIKTIRGIKLARIIQQAKKIDYSTNICMSLKNQSLGPKILWVTTPSTLDGITFTRNCKLPFHKLYQKKILTPQTYKRYTKIRDFISVISVHMR